VRIAWFSPLPPMASGIADYSFDLLPLMAEKVDVDVVCPTSGRGPTLQVPAGCRLVDPAAFASRAGSYDAAIHHLGNNPFHRFVYEEAMRRPALAVFHDFVLHHMIGNLTYEGRRDPGRYVALLRAEYGEAGARLADLRLRGIATEFEKFLFPLNGHVAHRARAIVVHSESVRDHLEHLSPRAEVRVIPHFAQAPPSAVAGLDRAGARRSLGVPEGAFVVGHFGFVTRPKQPEAVVGAFVRLRESRPDARLLFVGADHTGGVLQALLDRFGLDDRSVVRTGFADLPTFYRHLRASDVMVNLRYPSAGEASGTVARALAEGIPVVVNDLGSFAEIPDDVVVKVEPDEDQTDALARHLVRLADDPDERDRLSAAARRYAGEVLDAGRCRDLYLDVASSIGRVHRSSGGPSGGPDAARRTAELAGGSDPVEAARAMAAHRDARARLEDVAGSALPPSGGAIQLDLLYRLILRRPVEDAALRAAQLALAVGEASRSDLVRWMVESREFREIELVEKTLAGIRRSGEPFTVSPGEPLGPDTTERVVEIPWILSRWRGARRVLDLGYAYASGVYLTALLGLGIEDLHGVDWSAGPVPGMRRTRGDLRALPYRDASFDLVLCISTIEHVGLDNVRYGLAGHESVSGDVAALREIERVVRPGGRLLISIPFGKAQDIGWMLQYDSAGWQRLVAGGGLRVAEQSIFELTGYGWVPCQDVRSLEHIEYASSAPAARGVLCAELVRPG
jgi:glycosyltransferase involved in cell wall biosynthesis/SAM-dependent methyltransferase